MKHQIMSQVESAFANNQDFKSQSSRIPYILVDNFPDLGLLTSLRFLEWASENPEGIISLPTGKTPEYFIKWTQYIIQNWDTKDLHKLRHDHGLELKQKPNPGA